MEKLIELLNEYERSKGTNIEITYWECVYWNLSYFRYGNWYSNLLCISKSYYFIHWLVNNDKIDRDRTFKENWLFKMYFYDLEYVKNYDKLIMWLSVEDKPIEFLISILK